MVIYGIVVYQIKALNLFFPAMPVLFNLFGVLGVRVKETSCRDLNGTVRIGMVLHATPGYNIFAS